MCPKHRDPPRAHAGLVTALLCTAQFIVVLDVTIVAIALPAIQRDLHLSVTGLQWVVTAYTLAFGGLLLPAGRAGDRYGHRRLFVLGLVAFGLGSLACGLAPTATTLVTARVVQGTGAAVVAPTALSLLGAAFPAGPARRRAVAWWTASAAGGGAGGWVLGGLITEGLGWRWVFLVNVPIAAVAAVAARPVLIVAARRARDRLDLPGALTVTAALALLIHDLSTMPDRGMTAGVLAETTGAVVLLAVFVLIESRSRRPLLPLSAVRASPLRTAAAVGAALTATTTPALFFAVLYQQKVLGQGALTVGIRCAPVNLAVIAGAAMGPRLLTRTGPRAVMAAGLWLVAAGAATLLATGPGGGYLSVLLPAFLLMGAGLGAASVASTASGTADGADEEPGLASGLLNAAAQIGTVLGLAACTGLATARTGTADAAGRLLAGYHLVFAASGLIAALGAVLLHLGAAPATVRAPLRERS
jgi:EmrB/QacA subfamily drug resistance transporter